MNSDLLERWHDVHLEVLLDTHDERTAVTKADQAVCEHKKTHREYPSDFFEDPIKLPYQHDYWIQCDKCYAILSTGRNTEDEYAYTQMV